MSVITKKYSLLWKLEFAPNYQFDKDGNCFNLKSGKQIKQTIVGYTVGYCINSKFYSLKKLRQFLIRIKKEDCPF